MKKYLIITGILAWLSLGGSALTASANSSYIYINVTTAAATSTVTSLPTGTATSIITDSYSSGIPRLNSSATIFVQMTASTSASVLNIAVTYSQDGIDYFQDSVNVSTTTAIRNLSTPNSYQLTGNTTASTTRSAFVINTPTRYAKVTFTSAAATSTVWAAILPQRESVQ